MAVAGVETEVGVEGESKRVKDPSEAINVGDSTASLSVKERDKKRHRDGSSSRHHKKSRDGGVPVDGVVAPPLPGRAVSSSAIIQSCKGYVDKVYCFCLFITFLYVFPLGFCVLPLSFEFRSYLWSWSSC